MNWIKPDWPVAKNIHAAVTLRSGGVSHSPFDSLNPADHVNDQAKNVQANRKIIMDMLQLPSEPKWLQQVHGSQVVKADQMETMEQADASYTDQANCICAILTADCLPILLATNDGTKIAAIHGGWRSLLTDIISNTVNKLDSTNIIAWLGPAIGVDRFEVGAEIKQHFVGKSAKFATAFKATKFKKAGQNKYLADIYQLARIELTTLGITQIYGGNFCTVTEQQRFFSYRRDGETGRMATLIWRD
ncbi:MAG: peptidoglycan editing factor PgeF [Methylococcales bacterium]|nr:peptidoglycan editing factor PgeF [Methylococcales bacterium]